jgi:purine-binding chemotaxis protein CheW
MSHENRYLLFEVGKELYGTPLLDVREVVEYQEPKFMPNMVSHFVGVINIRGSIVGVIDLRKRFGEKSNSNVKTAMLVSDTPQGTIAAIVDRVDSVISIDQKSIDEKPPVVTSVKQDYLTGVAKAKDRLVTIVELQKLLGDENLVSKAA